MEMIGCAVLLALATVAVLEALTIVRARIAAERVADQAVLAGTADVLTVAGAASPWVESTCQYFVPAVSDVTVHCGPVIWLLM